MKNRRLLFNPVMIMAVLCVLAFTLCPIVTAKANKNMGINFGDSVTKTLEKSAEKPWYKVWWVWAIIAVVLVVATFVTMGSSGFVVPPGGVAGV